MKLNFHFKWMLSIMAIAVISASIAFTACSNEETPESSQPTGNESGQSAAYADLMKELKEYTESFKATHPTKSTASRGDHGWGRFWRSVKADYFSYTDANARHDVMSISASRKEWKRLRSEAIQEKLLESLGEPVEDPGELTTEETQAIHHSIDSLRNVFAQDPQNFGAIHNAAILNMFVENMDFNTTEELITQTVETLRTFGCDVDDVNISETVAALDDFFANVYIINNDDTTFENLKLRHSDRVMQIDIIKDYYTAVQDFTSLDDIQKFTKGYLKIIDKDFLIPEEREIIHGNISVFPSSSDLWNGSWHLKMP